jgi:hypothetical protein
LIDFAAHLTINHVVGDYEAFCSFPRYFPLGVKYPFKFLDATASSVKRLGAPPSATSH